MLLSEVRGQNHAVRTLERAVAQGRLAHAYLFDGPSGVGKQRAALGLAKALLCSRHPGKGCHSCPICHRIDAGNHPDARVFRPRDEGSRNIQVETLRSEILPVSQYAPFEGQAAVLIFPEADVSFPLQHPEAANALLKTLEEPRPNVHFVLLAERPDRLLITIRSRCQRVRFGRLPQAVLEHVLESHEVREELWGPAIGLADGRADRALALCVDGLAQNLVERAVRIDTLLGQGKTGRLIELSEELSKQADLPLMLETLTLFYRDVALRALGGERHALLFQSASAEIDARARKLGAARAAQHAHTLSQLPDLFARNANAQITLDRVLLELAG